MNFLVRTAKMRLPLQIDNTKLKMYLVVKNADTDNIPPDLIPLFNMLYSLSHNSLKSKQCNEPYERLLAEILNLKSNPGKHGWDAWNNDTPETSTEFYEFKPCGSTTLSATINDDSHAKIEKCIPQKLEHFHWLVLAKIDRETYSFSEIYKFPMEIYHEDRMAYLSKIIEDNKNKTKQTRVTYSITPKKSVELCEQFNLDYYYWSSSI